MLPPKLFGAFMMRFSAAIFLPCSHCSMMIFPLDRGRRLPVFFRHLPNSAGSRQGMGGSKRQTSVRHLEDQFQLYRGAEREACDPIH
jgi:hypothetical protein